MLNESNTDLATLQTELEDTVEGLMETKASPTLFSHALPNS